eukprot:CAMPEP_0201709482 /NCGR_PEP_ID=MMETSP0578-20130828/58127_1 /ASSEMBLY_ACC=CAM_ASM_000663 /TAXON_ID=267565 /ORGANISM="Skeletonema grethea, Strain CCMP 1804" /LENGTH=265 /DNA_ID=CAMNT_0048198459 /DNA_START=177 /DNA_END=974 /DNA_ORIENTATION=-
MEGNRCDDDDDYFSSEDIDALYNLNNDTNSTASPDPESFHPGDHVWMWCETAGGVRYQHHGIVLYANNNNAGQKNQKQPLKIADFTAPDSGTFAIPDSVASGSAMNSNHRLPHWHGVRVTTYESVSEWQKEEYLGDNCADDNVIVLQRVKFLLSNPHLIPKYDLLESNCETVAVWCKTGCFRTFQVAGMVDGGKRNSITVAASGVLASSLLGPLALPAIAGGALSFSALLLKENRNESIWMERTKILNDEFQRWQEGQEQVCCIL